MSNEVLFQEERFLKKRFFLFFVGMINISVMRGGGSMDICEHLKAVLEEELKLGNRVVEVFEDEWENESYSVRLKRPLNKKKRDLYLSFSPTITYWEKKINMYHFAVVVIMN